MYIYLAFALVGGFLLANQNPINADLRKIVGSPFLASGISNFVGSIFLGIITLVTSQTLFPSFQFVGSHPAWIWIGGVLGGIFLTSNVLLFPRLGAVQTVILPILGQLLMGALIDSFGWFHAMQLPMTLMRFLGIIITLAGVIVAVVLPNLKEKEAETHQTNLLGWRIWAVIVGAMSAAQQAINGRLGVLLENTAQAAFVSFFIGFLAIFIVSLFIDHRLPKISEFLGASFVFATVVAVPQIGAGLTIMMGLIGQILGSMLVQQFGWWRSSKYGIQIWQIVGILIMLTGIIFIKFL